MVTIYTSIEILCNCPRSVTCVFCIIFRINSEYFHLQNYPTNFFLKERRLCLHESGSEILNTSYTQNLCSAILIHVLPLRPERRCLTFGPLWEWRMTHLSARPDGSRLREYLVQRHSGDVCSGGYESYETDVGSTIPHCENNFDTAACCTGLGIDNEVLSSEVFISLN
jgi:hypothetical protein